MVVSHAHPLPPDGADLPLDSSPVRSSYYVVGIDTSSARLAASLPKQKTFVRDAEGEPDERRAQLFFAARDLFKAVAAGGRGKEIHVFCEEPLSLQNGSTTRLLGLAAGAIWAAHLEYDLFWHWMNVSTWKRELGLGGNTKKEFVRPAIEGIPAFRHEDREQFLTYPDLYDAWAIRMTGVRLLFQR